MAYREEVEEIIQGIPRQIFGDWSSLRRTHERPCFRLSATGAHSQDHGELHRLSKSPISMPSSMELTLAAAEGAGGAPPKRGTEGEQLITCFR
ncbi:MAG TPA: hypothetical protein VH684_01565 [Xanthobacteraceae bacterium]|jgi:hypothetical protein